MAKMGAGGVLKDTLVGSPDGLSGACQKAVTATCPSLRTVTVYKQTITLVVAAHSRKCECVRVCLCARAHKGSPASKHDREGASSKLHDAATVLETVHFVQSYVLFL